jgi:hypothetical protein
MTAVREAARVAVFPVPATTSGFRRVSLALAMMVAPWGFVIANAAYMWSIRNGGSDESGAAALALAAEYGPLLRVGLVAGMIGCLLIVPAVLGALRLAPASWAALLGGSLMIAGYVCYFGVLASNFLIIAMAQRGGPLADYAAAIDASQAHPSTTWVFLFFVLGNLVGTLVFAIGLLRSRAVPGWAAVSIMLWPPLHVIGLAVFGNEVPQVVGAALQAIGFAGAAAALLRQRQVTPLR